MDVDIPGTGIKGSCELPSAGNLCPLQEQYMLLTAEPLFALMWWLSFVKLLALASVLDWWKTRVYFSVGIHKGVKICPECGQQ